LAPDATEIVQNGGFETGNLNGWTPVGSPSVISSEKHSGNYAARLTNGNNQNNRIYQALAFPSNIVSATLTFWLKITTAETYYGYDLLWLGFYRVSDGTLVMPLGVLDGKLGSGSQWVQVTYLFDANTVNAVKGQTLYLLFGGVTDDSLTTRFYLDDISLQYETTTPGGKHPFRVTLVWTDYPGTPGAAKALVNDLDLEVVAPDGTRYYGNNATAGSRDRVNNAESVWLADAPAGVWQIIVKAHNVAQSTQPYALVVSGPTWPPRSRYLPLVYKGF
jgi:hypothetical protein